MRRACALRYALGNPILIDATRAARVECNHLKTSLMQGVYPEANVVDWTWQRFKEWIKSHSSARADESDSEKKRSPSFSCCEFARGYRLKENILGRMWAVVLDIDEVISGEIISEKLRRWTYIAWTTWSSIAGAETWRVVLPLSDGGCEPAELGAIVSRLVRSIGAAGRIDKASRDAAHLWFAPWHKRVNTAAHRIWENDTSLMLPPKAEVITIDFRGVPSSRPEKIMRGERNTALFKHLMDYRHSDSRVSRAELTSEARAWNARLERPMSDREARRVARSVYDRRLRSVRALLTELPLDAEVDIWKAFRPIEWVDAPLPVMGNFLYPGAMLLTGKSKEGKSMLTMQMAVALASGTPFLESDVWAGFGVREKLRVMIFAIEDEEWSMAKRYLGNVNAGRLPDWDRESIIYCTAEDLYKARGEPAVDGMPGREWLRALIASGYRRGYRVIFIDPVRIMEALIGIEEGANGRRNVHTADLLTTFLYNRLATEFPGLCVILSIHQGKNRRDQDANDPGDLIAGSSGLGAGANGTISIMQNLPAGLANEKWDEGTAKKRQLHIQARHSLEQRLLIEQDRATGLWTCLGTVASNLVNQTAGRYFEALMELGGRENWITSGALAAHLGIGPNSARRVLKRMETVQWRGYYVRGKSNGGYHLFRVRNG